MSLCLNENRRVVATLLSCITMGAIQGVLWQIALAFKHECITRSRFVKETSIWIDSTDYTKFHLARGQENFRSKFKLSAPLLVGEK